MTGPASPGRTPTGPPAHDPRDSHTYKALLRKYRAHSAEHQLGCWLCPQPIDYDLTYPHPESFSTDHARTVDAHPELAEDWYNLRPSHLICNQRRGTDDPHIDIGTPSETW